VLPTSLYVLNPRYDSPNRGVWRLDPGVTEAVRVTPPDLQVTAFDVWPDDGRMAYGTQDGRLYLVMPEQELRLLYDVGQQSDYAFSIDSLAWSPDGSQLAYSLLYQDWETDFESRPNVESLSGLWLLNLQDGAQTRLLSNQHPDEDVGDWPYGRIYTDPIWSPDGTALILRVGHWEGSDVAWLDPAGYQPDETNLHDPPELFWQHGS